MTVLVGAVAGPGIVRDRVHALDAEVFDDLASVEALWRRLETDPAALATPYQRFDWVKAFVAGAFGTGPRRRAPSLRITVLRDAAGRPRLLMPLAVTREYGVRVARVIGAKHANLHMPLFASREAASLDPDEVLAALARTGRAVGIDVFALDFQPRFWDGVANPLAARGQPCPSNAYGVLLGPDPDATLRRIYSGDARKKLRTKERKLVEAHGTVDYLTASAPDEIAAILDAFYVQKGARIRSMGVADPYAEPGIRRFIALATARDADGEPPAPIELHALRLCASGRILATFGGAVDGARFSGMWTSFDADPEFGRFSPGDLLLHRLIGVQVEAGRRAFDLGVGEARYKASICDETIELVRTTIPVTLRGHAFAASVQAATGLKRRIKRSARLSGLVRRFRRRSA